MFKKAKHIIIGFIAGVFFCGVVATGIAALPQSRTDREFEKFSETVDGLPSVLISVVE